MKQATAVLGRRQKRRFPISARTGIRLFCSRQKPGSRGAADPTLPEAKTRYAPESKPTSKGKPTPEQPAQVRAQVQQLQFWLKVFSRFCQEDPNQEPS